MHDDIDHPLLVELTSLRNTAARFQHEAHTAAIKLQRSSLDSSRLHEHAVALGEENARLVHELEVLRTHPDVPPHPAVAQAQELSLALRRVSDKIALTEDTLFQRTSELTDARSDLAKARHSADGAYALAAHMRAREEACKARERELEFKARASDEERKMVDLVVQEYADLVRNLEGRNSAPNGSTSSIIDNLQNSKSALQGVLIAFSIESEQLHATIAELDAKVSDLQSTLDAERLTAAHDRTLLSQAKTELDKLDLEDRSAAKMVARYMKFSQASTNALQQQISTLRTRHASTVNTLELQLSIAESQLASERARTARLQDALDELCEDLARESYGRRREVALRLALLSREDAIAEFMRRWARRARESYARCYHDSAQPSPPSEYSVQEAFRRVVGDAESLLSTLDDDVQISDTIRASGSLARIALSREAVDALRSELQDELQKRLDAVRKGVFSLPECHLDETTIKIEDHLHPKATPPQGAPVGLPLTPNGNAGPEHEATSVELPQSSPNTIIGTIKEPTDDPFSVPTLITKPTEQTTVRWELHSTPSPTMRGSDSTLATLLVDEEPKNLKYQSPVVSVLDIEQDLQPHSEESYDVQNNVLPEVILSLPETNQILPENDAPLPSTSISTPIPVVSHAALSPPSDSRPTLVSALGATKHRYDTLQFAFRDCSLALKELKRTLASSSPSAHSQTKLRQHLEMAIARIDDYAEDARVELEIRIADEELTARGFETVLSVPGALADLDERAEMEASARSFVDGMDVGVARASDKFGKKLEDVQHDVAVVKRALHGWAGEDEGVDGGKDGGVGSGWTAWTAGLLGTNTSPSRSPTPVQTFGTVITSPRLRPATSDESPVHGPLATLNLRIPMLSQGTSGVHLGVGRPAEPSRPRTLSAMYAMGGLRSSSVGFGVGLGSPSPARTRTQGLGGQGGLGWGNVSLRTNMDDTHAGEHDLGDVE